MGTKVGLEFRVNTETKNSQWQPAVSAMADKGFVITWTSVNQDGDGSGIFGQAYDASGIRENAEFRVNPNAQGQQSDSSVAALSAGNFVAFWTDAQGSKLPEILGQRFRIPGIN